MNPAQVSLRLTNVMLRSCSSVWSLQAGLLSSTSIRSSTEASSSSAFRHIFSGVLWAFLGFQHQVMGWVQPRTALPSHPCSRGI